MYMCVLWKSDQYSQLVALYEILPKNVHFALSRHQERILKIRIHTMKNNINAVILIPKLWRSNYPRDRSNWRKTVWAGPNFSILSDNSDMLFHMDRSK